MDDSMKEFEQSHIRRLQDERVGIQQKTFTKWMNSHLKRADLEVKNLFKDLADGKVLIKLMEVISDVNLGKPNRGTMRVQKIENVNKALQFIRSKVQLENIGAEDIVDGNERLILGLIWTIILRFQIQEMMIQTDDNESGEKRSGKDALLLWCQNKTKGYKNVNIKDFHKSWRDGTAFNALIHAHCPELIDYDKIIPENHQPNLAQAFDVADKDLGVPKLLDPEDIDVTRPDDKSIMTYVSSLYMTFAKMKTESTGAKRIGKIVSNAVEVSKMIEDYEKVVRDLLQWIQKKILELNNRQFPNTLALMQGEMIKFKDYRTVEKPPKFTERASVDEKLFQIILKMKQNNMKMYVPPEGLLAKEVEVAWDKLEKSEHSREMALREEILRQEKLEQTAAKFQKKAALRESWLHEMFNILTNMEKTKTEVSLEALINKKELLENDVSTKKERFIKLQELSNHLESNGYYASEPIIVRNDEIQRLWKTLQTKVSNNQSETEALENLCSLLRTAHTIKLEYENLEPLIKSTEFGKHLMAAEDLLERHNLLDSQLKSLVERFRKLKYKSDDFLESLKSKGISPEQRSCLVNEIGKLENNLHSLSSISVDRKEQLLKNCEIHKLMSELEEEESWITNQIKILSSKDVGQDLPSVLRQIRRHQIYESEIEAHLPTFKKLEQQVNVLFSTNNNASGKNVVPTDKLIARLKTLTTAWNQLEKVKSERRHLLKDAHECQKYYVDADDAQQWMEELFPLVVNNDNGSDAGSAQALNKRHKGLIEDIKIFGANDMKRLEELAILMTKPQEKHNIRPEQITSKRNQLDSLDSLNVLMKNNMIQIPMVETKKYNLEDIDNFEYAVAINNYSARDPNNRDINLVKDENYKIIKKKNNDWWQVETKNHQRGHAPASYLKVISKPQDPQRPQSTESAVKMQWVPIDSEEGRKFLQRSSVRKSVNETIFQGPTARTENDLHYDKVNIERRQNQLNDQYNQLIGLAKAREMNLVGSTLCHQFMKDCQIFEEWMNEKERLLTQQESFATNVEGTKKKYEAIIDDLAANCHRMKDIKDQADKISQLNPANEPEIKKVDTKMLSKIPYPVDKPKINNRHKEIANKWDKLNKLKSDTEKSLAGTSSIDLFNKTANELKESLLEKIELVDDNDVGRNRESNEALKRKFHNFKIEVDLIGTRLERCKYMGDGVKKNNPNETKYVDGKLKELQDLFNQLQKAMKQRESDLNNAGNIHKFFNEAKDLNDTVDSLTDILEMPITLKDIGSVESCMKQHVPVKDDILGAEERLKELKKAGEDILKQNPANKAVNENIKALADKMQKLKDEEKQREKELQDALNAQKFYRDCDQVESKIGQQNFKIDLINPEPNSKDVEVGLKNADEITATICQLDNRVAELGNNKDKLGKDSNSEMDKINGKLDKVKIKLKDLHDKADRKKSDLNKDLKFAQFKTNAGDLNEWIDDKTDFLNDDDYKELFNLEKNMKKHKAFEAEVKANTPALEKINKEGKDLLTEKHPRSPEIQAILADLNDKWSKLTVGSDDKEKKFKQAQQECLLNNDVDEMNRLFDNMQNALKSSQLGENLPDAKRLLDKHNDIESNLASYKAKLDQLKKKAAAMSDDDHFNKDKINEEINKLQAKCELLQPMVDARKKKLQDNLKWHQYAFDVDQELQWIEDHRLLASNTDYGRSFDEAVKLNNKHKKLYNEINGHKPSIQKLLATAEPLKKQIQPTYHKDIDTRSATLRNEWDRLEQISECRKKKLELSEQGQQLLNDLNEIDTWVGEHSLLVDQTNAANLDCDQVASRTAKLNNIALDLGTYQSIFDKKGANMKSFQTDCNEENILPELVECVQNKYHGVKDNLRNLKDSVADKQKALKDTENYQAFVFEINDIEMKIDDIAKLNNSNNYGHDLEELEIMKSRWDNQLPNIKALETRVGACNASAEKLIDEANPFESEVITMQEDINKHFNDLMQFVKVKNSNFLTAEEMHVFNNMCEELEENIDTAKLLLPSTACKDQNALNKLVKKYDEFEVDMASMKEQLAKLSSMGEDFKVKYPVNSNMIEENLTNLTNAYDDLRNTADIKNEELKDTMNYLCLYDEVSGMRGFLDELNTDINTDHKPTNVYASADQVKYANELRKKLDDEEDAFKKLVSDSEDIINTPSCKYVDEIQNLIDALLNDKAQTSDALDKWLIDANDLHIQQVIMKEITSINSSTNLQLAKLKATTLGEDLEKTERILQNHHIFSETINETDLRMEATSKSIEKINANKHFDAKNLSALFKECCERRNKLHDFYKSVDKNLNDQLKWLKFQRDSDDKHLWINEKLGEIQTMDNTADTLEEKIDLLQKYNALEAEITANKPSFVEYEENANKLMKESPHNEEIKKVSKSVLDKWQKLLNDCKYQSTVLKETRSLLTFFSEIDGVETWLRKKEDLVSADQIGSDLSHCESLQAELTEPVDGKQVDNARIQALTQSAQELLKQKTIPTNEAENVKYRSANVADRWNKLGVGLKEYGDRLNKAHKLHKFYSDLCLLSEQIKDKNRILQNKDVGNDVRSVDKLKRKHEALERDVIAIRDKYDTLKSQDSNNESLNPKYLDKIKSKKNEIDKDLEMLTVLAKKRHGLLNFNHKYQKIRKDADTVIQSLKALVDTIDHESDPTNIAATKMLIAELNNQIAAELSTNKVKSKRLSDLCQNLLADRKELLKELGVGDDAVFPNETEIVSVKNELLAATTEASEKCKTRERNLKDILKLQEFLEDCDNEEEWLVAQATTCTNLMKQLNQGTNDIDEILKTHKSISSLLATKQKNIINGKLKENYQQVQEIKSCKVTESAVKYENVQAQVNNLKQILDKLDKTLHDEYQLQDFYQRVSYHMLWIRNKIAITNEENYLDHLNMMNKITKHKDFIKEVMSNEPDIQDTINLGQTMINESHRASVDVEKHVSDLQLQWKNLLNLQTLKLERLVQTKDYVDWSRQTDNLISWMEELEDVLSSNDYGKDLISVKILKSKQIETKEDIDSHNDMLKQLKTQGQEMIKNKNYLSDDIGDKMKRFEENFDELSETYKSYMKNLTDTELFHQLKLDVDYEMDWINEKINYMTETQLANTISEVDLQESKQSSLELEITTRRDVFKEINKRALSLEESEHYARDKVIRMRRDLSSAVDNIDKLSKERKVKLAQLRVYLVFTKDLMDIEDRINEKCIKLNKITPGNSEQICENQMKKLEDIRLNVEAESTPVEQMKERANQLSDDCQTQVINDLKRLDDKLIEVREMLKTKTKLTMDNLKYYQFEREAAEQINWSRRTNSQLLSEDYGKDYDDCLIIIQNLQKINQSINSNKNKRDILESNSKKMRADKNPFGDKIDQLYNIIVQSFVEVKKNFNERKEALDGALQVHLFDQNTNEMIDWIKGKIIELKPILSDADKSTDSESVVFEKGDEEFGTALSVIKKHEGDLNKLERQVDVEKRQLDNLTDKSKKLINKFPDTEEHISMKINQLRSIWSDLVTALKYRKERLSECHQYQNWLSVYNDLLKWARDMNNKVLSIMTLPTDLDEAGELLKINGEQKMEKDSKAVQLDEILKFGDEIRKSTKYINALMETKQHNLRTIWDTLCANLERRRDLYEQNLDLRKFMMTIKDLEKWIEDNKSKMKAKPDRSFKTVSDVEDAVKNHDDFMRYVEEEEKKFEAIKRLTQIEENFKKQLDVESKQRFMNMDGGGSIKRRETQRIMAERQKELDQRKAANTVVKRVESGGVVDQNVSEKPKAVLKKQKSTGQLDLTSIANTGKLVPKYDPKMSNVPEVEEMEEPVPLLRKPASFSTRKKDPIQIERRLSEEIAKPTINYQYTGQVELKQVFGPKNIKPLVRKWKSYFAVLYGHNLLMFKDASIFEKHPDHSHSSHNIYQAVISPVTDYHKSDFVASIRCNDDSEIYIKLANTKDFNNWVSKLQINSKLSQDQEIKLIQSSAVKPQLVSQPESPLSHSAHLKGPLLSPPPPTIDVSAVMEDDVASMSSLDDKTDDVKGNVSPIPTPRVKSQVYPKEPQAQAGDSRTLSASVDKRHTRAVNRPLSVACNAEVSHIGARGSSANNNNNDKFNKYVPKENIMKKSTQSAGEPVRSYLYGSMISRKGPPVAPYLSQRLSMDLKSKSTTLEPGSKTKKPKSGILGFLSKKTSGHKGKEDEV